ncbi:unnamed protein product [Ectocarpus sp. CCAP 1310/34]|nr:unnamed protein product [Ectocarpus sp. CCAP 1310/34]
MVKELCDKYGADYQLLEKQNAERRCAPGAGSTSFGGAHASEERARAKVLQRELSTAGSQRASEGGGAARKLPPLGADIQKKLSAQNEVDLAYITGATTEQVDLVPTKGFTQEQLPLETAVCILEQAVGNRLRAPWGNLSLQDFSVVKGAGFEISGFDAYMVKELCDKYGADYQLFMACDRVSVYTDGWTVGDTGCPTEEELDGLSEKLATLLVYGTVKPNNGTSPEHPSSASSSGSSDVFDLSGDGQAGGGGKRAPKSSRKTRNTTNRASEDGLLQMMREASQKQDNAFELQLQREEFKNRRRSDEKKEAAQVRKEDRDFAEQQRKEERERERELRQEQWDRERKARKDERDDERRERQDLQDFELKKLKMQLELAQYQAQLEKHQADS